MEPPSESVGYEERIANFVRIQRDQATPRSVMRLVLNGTPYSKVRTVQAKLVELVDFQEERLDDTGGGVFLPSDKKRKVILVEIKGGNRLEYLAAIQRQLYSLRADWCHPTGDIQPEMSP
ncbi:uncharacterized protein LOC143450779 [Clavelina lepadiformis]|uniref:uncharacterized protein LOC143450779 n=1 Tax=Clavelina lepadiformis TaxID=159417 RepID=UPI0040425924